jgi:hypothetical protein
VGLKSRFNTDAFRVESYDIVTALTALREIGAPDASIAMTIDPQLKIESMIDPLSRAAAMRYYGITPETEWEYWKTELLSGDPSTRHYALYGIARFYPNVALEMLPKWARQVQTGHVYRLSAIRHWPIRSGPKLSIFSTNSRMNSAARPNSDAQLAALRSISMRGSAKSPWRRMPLLSAPRTRRRSSDRLGEGKARMCEPFPSVPLRHRHDGT